MNNKIILGTANFDFNYKLKRNKKLSKFKINNILKFCLENKIRFLDTANSYGDSEKIIGNFIDKNQNNFKIITKFKINNNYNIYNEYYKSYKSLNTKPWSIFFHNSSDFLRDKYRKQLFDLKKEKKINKIGVSVYKSDEIKKILDIDKPDILQIPINILDQRLINNDLLKKIKSNKIEIHARSIFLRGLLFYKVDDIIKIFPQIKNELLMLKEISYFNNISIADLSLLWVSKIKEIDKILIGVTSVKELKSNLNILNKKLKNNFFEKINKINITNEKIINPSKWRKIF